MGFTPEFEGDISERAFTERSPIGREFEWNGPGTGLPAYGASIPPPAPNDVNLSIETKHDDGDRSSGWIRRILSGTIVFELAPK